MNSIDPEMELLCDSEWECFKQLGITNAQFRRTYGITPKTMGENVLDFVRAGSYTRGKALHMEQDTGAFEGFGFKASGNMEGTGR